MFEFAFMFEFMKDFGSFHKLFLIFFHELQIVKVTVKLVYNDHLWDKVSVVVIERWLL